MAAHLLIATHAHPCAWADGSCVCNSATPTKSALYFFLCTMDLVSLAVEDDPRLMQVALGPH